MDNRTKTLFSFLLFAGIHISVGCGYNQQSKFQMYFLPPAPRGAAPLIELAQPPTLEPNIYLQDLPFLNAASVAPPRRSRGDSLVQQAAQAYQQGKRFYQANDPVSARVEFNRAIDLMLEASDQNPLDRQDYEKKLDELVDTIHRFDLAGLGASIEVTEALAVINPESSVIPDRHR